MARMADKNDNHTIKLLQDMRKEMNERVNAVDERFDDMHLQFQGMTQIMTLMAAHPHNIDDRVGDPETYVEMLKDRP